MVFVESASEEDLEPVAALDRLVLGSPRRRKWLSEAIRNGQCFVAKRDRTRIWTKANLS